MLNGNIWAFLKRLKQDKRAVTAIEYGLIAGLISVLIISAVVTIGTKLSTSMHTISVSV